MSFVPFDPLVPPSPVIPKRGRRGRPRTESPQAAYAFSLFCALPSHERTYRAVLNMLVREGKCKPTSIRLIENWGSKWNWNERVKYYDAQKIEEKREIWERERVQMHEYVSQSAHEVYEEVAKLLLQRAKGGQLGNDAAVQLIKIAADLEHRSRETLVGRDKDQRPAAGVQIIIETDPEPRTLPGSAPPRVTVNQAPELLTAGLPDTVEGSLAGDGYDETWPPPPPPDEAGAQGSGGHDGEGSPF